VPDAPRLKTPRMKTMVGGGAAGGYLPAEQEKERSA
jgi:hypothetical protein